MESFRYVTYGVLAGAVLLALVPVGQLANRWAEGAQAAAPTTDWVRWAEEEEEDALVAAYVHPGSPAAQAGLREGDALYMFSYRPYRSAAALQDAVAAVPPGEKRAYHVFRDGRFERLSVTLTPQPAFLYPLSSGLWNFSLWGFAFGAFFHLLGLVVMVPLARRSRRARFSLLLLSASAVWIFSLLACLLFVELAGLPAAGSGQRLLMDGLALAGALSWGAFPALLLHKVTCDTQEAVGQAPTRLRFAVYAPLLALLLAFFLAAGWPPASAASLLPALLVPLLLYTCVFVAAAATLVLAYLRAAPAASTPVSSWSDTGGAALLVSAVLAAGLVLWAVPFAPPVTGTAVGWLVVSVQLLSTVPVAMVTLATLRHAAPSGTLMRALTYMAVLGGIFFAFVGGYTLIDAYFGRLGGVARRVAMGAFVVMLLLVFERLARRLRLYASHFFATGPQRAREALSRFQEQMRTILTHEALAQQTAAVVGEAFGARSVRLFLRAADASEVDLTLEDASQREAAQEDAELSAAGNVSTGNPSADRHEWITGSYHPEPPYLTTQHFERIWPYMQREGRVWARNPELRDSTLPEQRAQIFEERGVALALPIMGDGAPIGLLAMSGKKKRGEVYSLADLDLLRFLGGQLALATERLDLVARERALVRASAQAELAALRAQINPHFLFNALNTIASLIEVQPEEAEASVEHLAAIFRHILQTGSQPFVPLEEEFALARHYLHIEEVRFGEALAVEMDLPPALEHYAVPAFAVQTLVENAVKHGIAKKRGGGRVRVAARRQRAGGSGGERNGQRGLEVVVDDTGAGIEALFPAAAAPGGDGAAQEAAPGPERARSQSRKGNGNGGPQRPAGSPSYPAFYGIGLRNVADRLERLYGRTDLLRLSSAPGSGTTARLRLPPARGSQEGEAAASTAGAPPEALRRV